MAGYATGVTMRPESSIFKMREIASGVAIAASVSEISDSSFAVRTSDRSSRPSCLLHASRARKHCWEPSSHDQQGLAQPGRKRSSVLMSC